EPGQGSTFRLYFPRAEATAQAEGPTTHSSAIGIGTVLVAEDEPAVRDMTAQLLFRSGFAVVAVCGGAEAMARLEARAEPIEVLVTDVVMSQMSGIEL